MKLFACLYILFFLIAFNSRLFSQVSEKTGNLHPPLKIPMAFSGSFGELRRTHFHSGVDFKTNGKCGYRIYSSENGFVARIVVSPTGYGRAVYVQHPNGLMTVYAHLRNFAPRIEAYVRKQQYANERWDLDIGIGKGLLPVKKGEVIGYSGNAGSSGGPHLHYEVRDLLTQEPINPFFYFRPKDNIRPKIQQLYVYNVNKGRDVFSCPVDRYKVDYINKEFVLRKIKEIKADGVLGFGVRAKDFINGSWNSCGVYSLAMYINGQLKYRYEADRFSFSNTCCVNIVKDYKLDVEKHVKVYKSWVPGVSCFEGVKYCEGNGLLKVEKDSIYNIRFLVSDMVGNKSKLDFVVRGVVVTNGENRELGKDEFGGCCYGKSHIIKIGDLKVNIDKNALFDDVCFYPFIDTVREKGYYNDVVYCLGGDYVPLKKRIKLAIRLDTSFVSKAYFVNSLNGGAPVSVESVVEGDSLFCYVKNLGKYSVCFDTVAPRITPMGKYSLKHFGKNGRMFFKIGERESGVDKYEGRIDGVWVMTSYDAKRKMLECVFDKQRIKTGSRHKFVLTVSDKCGNVSSYTAEIYL